MKPGGHFCRKYICVFQLCTGAGGKIVQFLGIHQIHLLQITVFPRISLFHNKCFGIAQGSVIIGYPEISC